MHVFRRARVPVACLPSLPGRVAPANDPRIEPWREVDISINGNRIIGVADVAQRSSRPPMAGETDLGGAIVFPGLIDVHTHLDKAHTWNRAPNRRGEFWDAIQILRQDSALWTEADVYKRATFALRRAWGHGTVALRTHLDTGASVGAASHAVLEALRTEWEDRITIQTVSLCSLDAFAKGEASSIINLTARHGATALGGFPQPNPDLARQLDSLMAAAKELGIGLDLHVDESGFMHAECLRATAEAVLRNQFPYPVACGHCCSLSVQSPDRQRSTIDLVRAAGIRIISLPLCNLYLQGRSRAPAPTEGELGAPLTPQWRGLTLLHEFMEAGVTVACASDNVRDAFYAYGDLDAAEVYLQSVRLGHLDTRLAASPAVVTTAPAKIMGLDDIGAVAPGMRADLIAFEARSFNELLSLPGLPRRLIRGEAFRERVVPSYAELT